MKKDNVGFEYNLKNDNIEWDNVVKIAFDKNLDRRLDIKLSLS